MTVRLRTLLLCLIAGALFIPTSPTAEAQVLKRLRDRAARAAEDEAARHVERMIRSGVACAFNDLECIERAEESGDDVYLTDDEGKPVLDDDGMPVSDPDEAADILGKERPGASSLPGADAPLPGAGPLPGVGATTNLDFVPGEETVVFTDYSEDNLGDFPRRFELISGSFDVIEWEGDRYMRALSGGTFAIVLPETLPEKFTIETAVSVQHGNGYMAITPGRAFNTRPRDYRGSAVTVRFADAGVNAVADAGPVAMSPHHQDVVRTQVAPLQVLADGEHMKVYLDDNRVANVPNAVFPRTDTLFIAVGSAAQDHPILLGSVRIAASKVDLYDRLTRDGRVTTRGILFDVDSDVIQPESAPTLEEIGTTLQEHPDLRISIEGHTDSDGDEASNLDLSERRAEAVRARLIQEYGIDASRLESAGYGESRPVAPNDTPEGKQQNRRVELVRIG